ncbi:hypothetical protein NEIMUCOT_05898 [Neisseria mucosa ATCC 25996]|uniref:Uncharacterized protein n=1 Tax=Neisseria mucosa (strain ATCC 25996 / DSM 4631 / NCTC 10774 / M26) TaxID=546266 RepID=D2ZZ29_NEIM2|nr:hypothetical protein [Neisseria mucosa]EFC87673.1 hypothetical protein NEIMUCOT_05898 [Neisseria mucosa ATCC 25996]
MAYGLGILTISAKWIREGRVVRKKADQILSKRIFEEWSQRKSTGTVIPTQAGIQIFGFRKDLERHYSKSPDSRLRENDGKSSFYFNRPCFQTTFVSQIND